MVVCVCLLIVRSNGPSCPEQEHKFNGGATRFFDDSVCTLCVVCCVCWVCLHPLTVLQDPTKVIAEIAPKPGRALLFSQDLLHDGSTLLSGTHPTHQHTPYTYTLRHTHTQSGVRSSVRVDTRIHPQTHNTHIALTRASQAPSTYCALR